MPSFSSIGSRSISGEALPISSSLAIANLSQATTFGTVSATQRHELAVAPLSQATTFGSVAATERHKLSLAPLSQSNSFGSIAIPIPGSPVAPRFARPLSDVTTGTWLPSSGSSLAAMIDEPTADSSDYIYTTSASACTIALNPVVDPGTSSGQVVSYQVCSPEANALTVDLMQGETVIASWAHAALPTTPTVFARALTAPQCDSITDYTDLQFRFTAA